MSTSPAHLTLRKKSRATSEARYSRELGLSSFKPDGHVVDLREQRAAGVNGEVYLRQRARESALDYLEMAREIAHRARLNEYAAPVIDPFSFDPPETFATARLTLRLPEVEDADDLFAAMTNSAAHLRPFIDWAALDYEIDEVERRIRKTRSFFAQRDSFEWLLWADQGETLVGAVDLHSFNWSLRRGEFGFWTTAAGQGNGYIVEAGQAVLAWAQPMFTRIEARCNSRNVRSRRTVERLGFEFEGTLRRNIRDTAGQPADEHVFSRLAAGADEST